MRPLRILCVCTHNRTRSVLIGSLLANRFRQAESLHAVSTGGFAEPNLPPTDPTVRYLADRGIDASTHRSSRLTGGDIERADLIVTAEQMHVVEVAGRWPGSFSKTFTLPELIARHGLIDHVGHHEPEPWLAVVNDGRQAWNYLDIEVGEVADPTGESPATWRASASLIEELTLRLADALAMHAEVRR